MADLDKKDKGIDDEECEDNTKKEELKVHSANSWETADLGDSDRKNKFLRLMGAGKKEHHGRFVIGDQNPSHERKQEDTESVAKGLEDQYQQSMELRLTGGRKGHIGLGFHDQDEKDETNPSEGAEGKSELKSDQNEIRGGGNDVEGDIRDAGNGNGNGENKTESSLKHKLEDDKNEVESPTAIKKMKFVKGSS